MSTIKRLFSMLLAVVMVFSMLPIQALAAETGETEPTTVVEETTAPTTEETTVPTTEAATVPATEAATEATTEPSTPPRRTRKPRRAILRRVMQG